MSMPTNATTPSDGSTAQDYEARAILTAAPKTVFAALTTLDGLAHWWTTVTGHGHTGGELRFDFDQDRPLVLHVDAARHDAADHDAAGSATLVQWTCLECSWLPDWVGTVISFEVTPRPAGGCDLSFCHRGLTPQLACYEDCKNGWGHFIPSLTDYVETGRGNPRGSNADVERRTERDRRRTSTTAG